MKTVGDAVLDAAINHVINNADKVVLCEDRPTSYSAATTDSGSGGQALGESAISASNFSGPLDGDTDGRKGTLDAVSGIDVDVSAVCGFAALVDDGNTVLLYANMLPSAAITGVDTGTDTVTIDGDHTSDISAGDDVKIVDSTGNDGDYTVSSVSLNGSDTDVVLNESIGDSTADGSMIYGAQKLSSGNTTDLNAFDFEIADPT